MPAICKAQRTTLSPEVFKSTRLTIDTSFIHKLFTNLSIVTSLSLWHHYQLIKNTFAIYFADLKFILSIIKLDFYCICRKQQS